MKFKVTLVYNLRSTTSFVIDNHRSGVLHFCVKIYNGNLIRVDSSLFFQLLDDIRVRKCISENNYSKKN